MSKTWQRWLFNPTDEASIPYLFVRVFIGIAFIVHGWPKISGGPEAWMRLGSVMEKVGLGFAATFFGFMAALCEFGGGLLLVIGLLTPVAAAGILIVMITAVFLAHAGDPFAKRELALAYLVAMPMFIGKGAGWYSVDWLIGQRRAGPAGNGSAR